MFELKNFMKPELVKQKEATLPGLPIFTDEKGAIVPFKIKVLSPKRLLDIRRQYTKSTPIKDGKTFVHDKRGVAVVSQETDEIAASCRMYLEAFIEPDLNSEELRAYYENVARENGFKGVFTKEMLVETLFMQDNATMAALAEQFAEAHGFNTADEEALERAAENELAEGIEKAKN